MKKRQIFTWIIIIVIAGLSFAVIALASGVVLSRIYPEKYWSIPEKAVIAKQLPDTLMPGSLIPMKAVLTIPYGCEVEKAVVTPPGSSVSVGQPDIVWQYLWNRKIATINFYLRVYRSGEISGGKVDAEIVMPDDSVNLVQISIPDFTVAEFGAAASDSKVELAPEEILPEPDNRFFLIFIIGGVVLVIAVGAGIAFYIFKHRKKLSAAELTLIDLELLRRVIKDGKFSADRNFVRLVDIMKIFLAKQFNIILFSSTSEEFLETIRSCREVFPVECGGFFRDFLHRADLVKFAGANADDTLLISAIDGAEEFVRSSVVVATEKEAAK